MILDMFFGPAISYAAAPVTGQEAPTVVSLPTVAVSGTDTPAQETGKAQFKANSNAETSTGFLAASALSGATPPQISPSASLNPWDIAQLPGTPGITSVAPSGNPTTVSATARGVQIQYSTKTDGWAGGGFSYDNFSTTPIETRDLSQAGNLTFGLQGGVTQVKLELVDGVNQKAAVYLTGIRSDREQVWSIPLSLFSGMDLTKTRLIYFIVEGTNLTGTLAVNRAPAQHPSYAPSPVLTTGDIPPLPGAPAAAGVAPTGNPTTTTATARGVQIQYNTRTDGWAGGGFSFDNFTTTPVETQDLSQLTNLVLGLQGDAGQVKLELVDDAGKKNYVYLTGIRADKEQVWSVAMSSFSNMDLTKVRLIYLIVEGNNQTGTLKVNRLPEAPASSGYLTFKGSYTDATLQYPGAAVISPDSKFVYIGDMSNAGSITWFTRDSAGQLVYSGRVATASADIPMSLAVSADGKFLYVVTSGGGGVAWYSRNLTTGGLTYGGRCTNTNLSRVRYLTMSADGKNIYAVSEYDSSIAWLTRNAATGQLTYGGKYKDTANIPYPYSASISGDGKNVYVVLQSNKGIAWFTRNATTGALTYGGQYTGDVINGAASAVVSPDGAFVYVTAGYAKAVAWFGRNATSGALSYLGRCVVGSASQYGMDSIVLSKDGKHAYVTLKNDNAVAWLSRDISTGALVYEGMFSDASRLKYAGPIVLSLDGNYAVVAAGGSKTVSSFQWGTAPNFMITTTGNKASLISGLDMTVKAATPYSPVTAYQWYLDGVAVAGQNTDTITIGKNLAARANPYELKVGVTVNGITDFKIVSFAVKNTFAVSLAGVQANLEQDSNMRVTASTDYGASETYQWYLDGTALSGETAFETVLGKGLQARSAPYELKVGVTIGNITVWKAANFTVINRPYLDLSGTKALSYSITANTHTGVFTNAGTDMKASSPTTYIETRGFAQFNLSSFYGSGINVSQITKIELISDYVSSGGAPFSVCDMKSGETGSFSLNSKSFFVTNSLIRTVNAAEYRKGLQMDVTSAILADLNARKTWSGIVIKDAGSSGVDFSKNIHLRIYVNVSPTTIVFNGVPELLKRGTDMKVTAVTTPSPVTSYQWSMDGVVLPGQTGASLAAGSSLPAGKHRLTLVVVRNGLTSSRTVEFTVQ
jgi:6-phosphogluconolactonase (cycloisomerase 2 family)